MLETVCKGLLLRPVDDTLHQAIGYSYRDHQEDPSYPSPSMATPEKDERDQSSFGEQPL